MATQAADHYKKAEAHDEQAAHQHKQTRRAMRRTHEKKEAQGPPRTWPEPAGDPSWDGRGEVQYRTSLE
jgi:hypothetical protein